MRRFLGSSYVVLVFSIASLAQTEMPAPSAEATPVALSAPRTTLITPAAKRIQTAAPARFTFIGVKNAEDCGPALIAIRQEAEGLGYPVDWTFMVACTPLMWERMQRKSDHANALFAISELRHKITFLNAAVFREARHIYRRSMSHELGHIKCDCRDEETAERWAQKLESAQDVRMRNVAVIVPRPTH